MVGIGISSASAGSDAVSLANSSRSSRSSSSDGSSGFSDALSNSGNGRDDNATSRAASDANSADAGGAQGNASQTQDDASQPAAASAAAAAGNPGKPSDAPKAQGAAQSFAQALTAMPQAAQTLPVAADIATPATDTGAAKTSLADVAQQLAAMVDGDASGQPVADAKGNLPTVKGGKTTDATDKTADDDASASDATSATSTVSDALSLLGALPVTVVPAQTAASVLAAAGQLHTGNGKVVASSDGSVDAVSSDAVSDKADAVATGMAMLASTAIGSGSADTGTATDNDDATQAFSVARVNSKVQALDLAASKNSDDAAQLDLKTAAGDGAGNVTVLESRRFVGLAEGSNSSLVANSLTGNKDWAAAMAPSAALTGASATTSASKVMNSLKIQMNPDNLGIVTATMRLSGDQLSVDLKVQSAEAYRQLSNDQTAMADSLRQQGYSVDRITVSYTAPDTSTNSQSQGQPQPQQSGAGQGQGSDAQARKQNSGQQAGDQDAVWGTGTVATDDSVAGSAQRARAGSVYL